MYSLTAKETINSASENGMPSKSHLARHSFRHRSKQTRDSATGLRLKPRKGTRSLARADCSQSSMRIVWQKRRKAANVTDALFYVTVSFLRPKCNTCIAGPPATYQGRLRTTGTDTCLGPPTLHLIAYYITCLTNCRESETSLKRLASLFEL